MHRRSTHIRRLGCKYDQEPVQRAIAHRMEAGDAINVWVIRYKRDPDSKLSTRRAVTTYNLLFPDFVT